MVNGTNGSGSSDATALITKQSMYVGLGSYIVLSNAVILIAILSHQKLWRQKEIMLLLALAIADFIVGFAMFCGGSRRLVIIFFYDKDVIVTSWYCMTTPTTPLFTMMDLGPSCMFLTIAVDRLLAVVTTGYQHFGMPYARKMIGLGFGVPITTITIGAIGSFFLPRIRKISILCSSEDSYPTWFPQIIHGLSMVASWIGVFMYVAIAIMVIRLSKKTGNKQMDEIKVKRQIKVTKTVLIVVAFTITFHTLPFTFYWLMFVTNGADAADEYGQIIGIMVALNSGNNIFIYIAKHEELRVAILRVLSCFRNNSLVMPVTSVARSVGGRSSVAVTRNSIAVAPKPEE